MHYKEWGYSNDSAIHLGKQLAEKKYKTIWTGWITKFKGPDEETHLEKRCL